MRKLALISLALLAFVPAACGGGSGSSGEAGTSGPEAAAPRGSKKVSGAEAAWAKEVTAVMSRFENEVSAAAVEKINTTSSQLLLEPLYRAYGASLGKLAADLEATDAPPACVPIRQQLAAYGRAVSRLTGELGEQRGLSEEDFARLVFRQHAKISRYGSKLSALAAEPKC